MNFNTNSLGYKLLYSETFNSRKHSEQLNKCLAGLIDTDGSITVRYRNRTGLWEQNGIVINYVQAEVNDPGFKVITALCNFYKLGYLYTHTHDNGTRSTQWICKTRDSRKLFGLIGKHLVLKKEHFENLLWLQQELCGCKLTDYQVEELKLYSKCSRASSSLKVNTSRHYSFAYIAGVISGDGHIQFRPERKMKRGYTTSEMALRIKLHPMDLPILQVFLHNFGGTIINTTDGLVSYRLNLGKRSKKLALKFLGEVIYYTLHPHKYERMQQIIDFHLSSRRD